jgi:hypothetical protein
VKTIFQVAKTYQTVTPESAEMGDFEDSGFIFERRNDYSLKDIIDEINQNSVEHCQENGNGFDIYFSSYCSDYQTGEDTSECLHVSANPRAVKRLTKLFKNKRIMR